MGLIVWSRQAHPTTPPVGDIALVEIDVFQALHGKLLVGPYSVFHWHHPGPIYFFVQIPFYVLSGYRTAGLSVGALGINFGALVGLVWLARRVKRLSFVVVLTALCAVYLNRAPDLLASPWNPHVLILPMMLMLVAWAAVVSGEFSLLPLAVLLSTFAVQTHVGLLPMTAAVSFGSLVPPAVQTLSSGTEVGRNRFWFYATVSMVIAFILWLPPLIEEVSHRPGNLTQLWHFFVNSRDVGHSFRTSFLVWSSALSGFISPDFATAWGGRLPTPPTMLGQIWAVSQVVLLGVVGLRAARNRESFRFALATLLVVASLVSLWSVHHIAEEIVDHQVFWISGIGVLNTAVILEAAWVTLWPETSNISIQVAVPLCGVFIASVVAIGVSQLRLNIDHHHGLESEQIAAQTLFEEIRRFSEAHHTNKLLLDVDASAWGVVAGIIVELNKANIPVSVAQGSVWMFGEATAPTGNEKVMIVISSYERHEELAAKSGVVPIAAQRGFFADAIFL